MKAIIFDFFGVICQGPHHTWRIKHSDIKDKHEKYFETACVRADRGEISEEEFEKGLAEVTNIAFAEINKELEGYYIINQNLIEIIKKLKKNYKIIILSNAAQKIVENTLARNNLTELFDQIIVSSNIGLIKPDKEIFEYVLSKNNLKAEEVIFIDDNLENVESAKQLDISAILFTDVKKLEIDLGMNKINY